MKLLQVWASGQALAFVDQMSQLFVGIEITRFRPNRPAADMAEMENLISW